ncbi:MAG: hypothetical protein A3I72_10765 [Candidatus Tectomicrobia bacterium RIFCSPLOWO2_02_FULL_70_19]|nr:MAG: hypothetical protein A3I72_10765 [Candidatus Tectomicrobia bacterium RIFCSPLOWO2_02_FULL_70_19]
MLVAVAFTAAAVYVQTLPTEQGSIDIYGRRLSDLPDMVRLTHQQVIGQVLREIPGKLLGVRLREQNKTPVYEVEWVSAQGNTVWVSLIDAGSGAVLSRREIPDTRFVATR